MRPRISRALLASILAIASLSLRAVPARAQCDGHWLPGESAPGVEYSVSDLLNWDPDGPGPLPPVLVVGGGFDEAGGLPANRIATWDGTAWGTIGAGFSSSVYALAVLHDGSLVAAGAFSSAEGAPVNFIARWNGTSWTPMGSGFTSSVNALAVLPNGDLIAAGTFTNSGLLPIARIARWDGNTWSPLGSGITDASYLGARALAVAPNGDLFVGGGFTTAGGVPVNNIARWDGTTWSRLGSGVTADSFPTVYALAFLPNGDLAVGGGFTSAGGNPAGFVARWDGANWFAMNSGFNSSVYALAVSPDGTLYAGGAFRNTSGGPAMNHISRWTGSAWTYLGGGLDVSEYASVGAIAFLPSGLLVAGGTFELASGLYADNIAQWDGTNWSPLGWGVNGWIDTFATLPNGDLVAGGVFEAAGGRVTNRIAQHHNDWFALGTGLGNGQDYYNPDMVRALVVHPSLGLIAAGTFVQGNIVRWNGSTWTSIGPSGANDTVHSLALLPDGDVIATGAFTTIGGVSASRIARWNGSTWVALGSGLDAPAYVLAVLPNGHIIAAGAFLNAGGVPATRIARWNGSAWSPLGAGMNTFIRALAVLPNGDLIAGGNFTTAGGTPASRIARWNGSAWSPLADGFNDWVIALAVLPSGQLVAAGRFTASGATPLNRIARWSGSAWLPFDEGIDGPVYALHVLPGGDLIVGGDFINAGGHVSAHFARWHFPTCRADFNCDQSLSTQDFFDFLTAFFTDAPAADFTRDGLINSQDFFDFLAAFFVGC